MVCPPSKTAASRRWNQIANPKVEADLLKDLLHDDDNRNRYTKFFNQNLRFLTFALEKRDRAYCRKERGRSATKFGEFAIVLCFDRQYGGEPLRLRPWKYSGFRSPARFR